MQVSSHTSWRGGGGACTMDRYKKQGHAGATTLGHTSCLTAVHASILAPSPWQGFETTMGLVTWSPSAKQALRALPSERTVLQILASHRAVASGEVRKNPSGLDLDAAATIG